MGDNLVRAKTPTEVGTQTLKTGIFACAGSCGVTRESGAKLQPPYSQGVVKVVFMVLPGRIPMCVEYPDLIRVG